MRRDAKKLIRILVLTSFFTFIAVYTFFRSYSLIFGVKIKDVNIEDGVRVENSVIKVEGNAKNAILLTLNGREISIDKEGFFKEDIALLSGYNILSIRAQDKFGHQDEKIYKLIH